MKRFTILKPLLLLCALIVGVGNSWAAADVTYDFTGSDWTVKDGTLSDGTVSFTGEGGTNFKMSSGYFIMGKKGAYINFPTYSKPVEKIVITGRDGASGSVEQNIYVGDAEVSTKTTGATGTNTYEIASASQAAGTQYTLKVVSSHNTQITKIEVFFVDESKQNVTLSFPKESYSADIAEGANSFAAPVATASATIAGITYSSSNEAVATVDEASGAVTLVKKGETTIKASFAGDDTYNSAEASYTLTVTNSNANDGSESKPFTVEEAIDFIKAKEYGAGNYYVKGIISKITSKSVLTGGKLTYYISDDGTTTNQLQVYKGKNKDNAEFTAVDDITLGDNVIVVGPLLYYNETTPEINEGNYIYSTDHKTLADAELIVEDDFSMEVTETKSVDDLYATASDGEVTITSSNEEVAKIEEGVLKAVGKGSATITISVAATDVYFAASASFKVTVTVKDAVQPEGAGAGSYFAKVSSTEELVDGDYLIVYAGDDTHASVAFNGGLETLDAAKNGIAVTISDNKIGADDNTKAAAFTWNSKGKTLTNKSGVLIGNTSYANSLKTGASGLTNTIEFDESGNAVISAVESKSNNSYTTLRYNYASDNLRFRYYKSGQQAVQLYRLTDGGSTSFDITIGEAGWRTLVSSQDVTLPEGVEAYIVTEANEVAKLSKVDAVKANTPYILKGDADTYTLSLALGVTAPTGNLLQISTEATGNGVYVLANGIQGPGFYKWAGGSLGAGRVYLPAPAGARDFIGFSFGEATGVNDVTSKMADVRGAVYNMNGQRVAQPTKGLYIVNGKKYVVK